MGKTLAYLESLPLLRRGGLRTRSPWSASWTCRRGRTACGEAQGTSPRSQPPGSCSSFEFQKKVLMVISPENVFLKIPNFRRLSRQRLHCGYDELKRLLVNGKRYQMLHVVVPQLFWQINFTRKLKKRNSNFKSPLAGPSSWQSRPSCSCRGWWRTSVPSRSRRWRTRRTRTRNSQRNINLICSLNLNFRIPALPVWQTQRCECRNACPPRAATGGAGGGSTAGRWTAGSIWVVPNKINKFY